MTEADWLACPRPEPLLEYLDGKPGDRKLRLFGASCCRRVGDSFCNERGHHVLIASEQYADGDLTDEALDELNRELEDTIQSFGEDVWRSLHKLTYTRHHMAGFPDPAMVSWPIYMATWCAAQAWYRDGRQGDDCFSHIEMRVQADILREIVGNPFRPVAVEPAWFTAAVPAIARHIYDVRAFHDLPILADALEAAGCTNADLLAHCRGPGPHVRGCWAVDLLLGKA